MNLTLFYRSVSISTSNDHTSVFVWVLFRVFSPPVEQGGTCLSCFLLEE